MSGLAERCRVEVDVGAVAHNVGVLGERAGPALLCAVVKGDGYGHGALVVARAAVEAGASWLGVACVAEGVALRRDGLDVPILVLAEPPPGDFDALVEHDLRTAVYTPVGIEALAESARRHRTTARAHLKVDTGMYRAGCTVGAAVELARWISREPALKLEGLMTHLAAAEEADRSHTDVQLARFGEVLARLETAGLRPPLVHAANSAALFGHPAARFDLVRPGIALYGLGDGGAATGCPPLRPALSLHARVSRVVVLPAGEGVSYGRRWSTPRETVLATLSIGYADGVRRALGLAGAPVLVRGRKCPMVGVVTMDQLMVDCGPHAQVEVGDTATLIGRQGDEVVAARSWAELLGTIDYEVVTGIGPRVLRAYRPAPVADEVPGLPGADAR